MSREIHKHEKRRDLYWRKYSQCQQKRHTFKPRSSSPSTPKTKLRNEISPCLLPLLSLLLRMLLLLPPLFMQRFRGLAPAPQRPFSSFSWLLLPRLRFVGKRGVHTGAASEGQKDRFGTQGYTTGETKSTNRWHIASNARVGTNILAARRAQARPKGAGGAGEQQQQRTNMNMQNMWHK